MVVWEKWSQVFASQRPSKCVYTMTLITSSERPCTYIQNIIYIMILVPESQKMHFESHMQFFLRDMQFERSLTVVRFWSSFVWMHNCFVIALIVIWREVRLCCNSFDRFVESVWSQLAYVLSQLIVQWRHLTRVADLLSILTLVNANVVEFRFLFSFLIYALKTVTISLNCRLYYLFMERLELILYHSFLYYCQYLNSVEAMTNMKWFWWQQCSTFSVLFP